MLDRKKAEDDLKELIEQCKVFSESLQGIKICNINYENSIYDSPAPVVIDITSDDWRIFIKKVYKLLYNNLQISNKVENNYIDAYERIRNDIHIKGVTEKVIMDLNVLFNDILDYIKS